QTPDSIAMITAIGSVFGKHPLHGRRSEEAALESARAQEDFFQIIQLWSREPVCPRRWKTHLLSVNDVVREQVFDRFFQNLFSCQTMNCMLCRNSCGVLN